MAAHLTATALSHTEPPPGSRVLIVEDQTDILEALHLLLKSHGCQAELANSPAAALAAVEAQSFDAVLLDLNYSRDTTSGQEGLELVTRLHKMDDTLPLVVMTAWGSVELAVAAMQRGARDFIQKPWENRRLLEVLGAQIATGRAQRRLERLHAQESNEAREVWHGLLPKTMPNLPGYEIAVAGEAAPASGGLGGDYFDVWSPEPGCVQVCIADVAGKGLPAALLMSNLQAAVRAFSRARMAPGRLCGELNRIVQKNISPGRFITFFVGLLDGERRLLRFARAGHPPPILARADGSVLRLEAGGPLLGVFDEPVYEQGETELSTGDRLVLFTDGVSEAEHPARGLFGEERLTRLLVEHRQKTAAALCNAIRDAVAEFAGGKIQDDLSLVVVGAK